MGKLIAAAGLLLVVSCGSDNDSSVPTDASSTTTSIAPPPPALDVAECPVADEVFCAAAVNVASALRTGDADALVALSMRDTIVCAEMNVENFPGCADAETLEGYGLSGSDLLTYALDEPEYAESLREMVQAVDVAAIDSFSVGTCGPNIPGRRTYHLRWSVGDVVGSFEMLFDEDWRIVLVYGGAPVADWESNQPIPFDELFCEATRTPW